MTRKRHIVIVDDEANIGRSLRLILEGEGYRVSVFDSAAAFEMARLQAAADMYLLDEWDANLDPSNRAAADALVEELARRARVVEISHRDRV